jgi:hypothetical protein
MNLIIHETFRHEATKLQNYDLHFIYASNNINDIFGLISEV